MIAGDNHSIAASGNGQTSARQVHATYATRVMTDIYHLVESGGQHTLCGLRVSRLSSGRRANTLHLVTTLPGSLTICKHCERITNQDKGLFG